MYLPVVEDRQCEGLSLCVCAKVRLKAKWVNGWDESLDGVERRPRNRCVLGDVTPVRRKNTRLKFLHFKDNHDRWSLNSTSIWVILDWRIKIVPTFFEPTLCIQQRHNQLEPELPQSNKAPSTSEWPATQGSRTLTWGQKPRHTVWMNHVQLTHGLIIQTGKEQKERRKDAKSVKD